MATFLLRCINAAISFERMTSTFFSQGVIDYFLYTYFLNSVSAPDFKAHEIPYCLHDGTFSLESLFPNLLYFRAMGSTLCSRHRVVGFTGRFFYKYLKSQRSGTKNVSSNEKIL